MIKIIYLDFLNIFLNSWFYQWFYFGFFRAISGSWNWLINVGSSHRRCGSGNTFSSRRIPFNPFDLNEQIFSRRVSRLGLLNIFFNSWFYHWFYFGFFRAISGSWNWLINVGSSHRRCGSGNTFSSRRIPFNPFDLNEQIFSRRVSRPGIDRSRK